MIALPLLIFGIGLAVYLVTRGEPGESIFAKPVRACGCAGISFWTL
jgi:hypothetical protein